MFSALLSSSAASQTLTIAAAADLAPLETPLITAFRAISPIPVRFTFGSSGQLATQIENGAPFDLYLSANEEFVQRLAGQGKLLPNSVRAYATGRVGLWSSSGQIKTVNDLLKSEVRHLAIPNPKHAPYGMAAEQMLRKLGLWSRIESKLVFGENVRQTFEYARTGNADAVLTSWTLLFDKGGILLPDSHHAPIRQSGGVVRDSANASQAQMFLQMLCGGAGQQVLRRYGLFPPAPVTMSR